MVVPLLFDIQLHKKYSQLNDLLEPYCLIISDPVNCLQRELIQEVFLLDITCNLKLVTYKPS